MEVIGRLLLMLIVEVGVPDAADGLLVSLEHSDVVHVALPVFDIAAVIAGHHPLVSAAPGHTSDRKIVSLKGDGTSSCAERDRNAENTGRYASHRGGSGHPQPSSQ